jgi:hypothetical protein
VVVRGAHTNLYQLSTVVILAGEPRATAAGSSVYLGEKVVSENEYLSAMAICDVVAQESTGYYGEQTTVAGSEMDVSMELKL